MIYPFVNIASSASETICQLRRGLKLFQCWLYIEYKCWVICLYSESSTTEILHSNAAYNTAIVRQGVKTNIIVLIASVD